MMRSQFATGSASHRKLLTIYRTRRQNCQKKTRSELRQRFRRETRRDRVILHGRTEFVPYLLVNRINDLLTRKNGKTLPWIARIQSSVPICLPPRSLSAGGFVDCFDDFFAGEHA